MQLSFCFFWGWEQRAGSRATEREQCVLCVSFLWSQQEEVGRCLTRWLFDCQAAYSVYMRVFCMLFIETNLLIAIAAAAAWERWSAKAQVACLYCKSVLTCVTIFSAIVVIIIGAAARSSTTRATSPVLLSAMGKRVCLLFHTNSGAVVGASLVSGVE